MKLTKRLLSMLVAVVMVLSMIPAAYASEETEQNDTWTPNPSTTYEADEWIEVSTGEELQAYMTGKVSVNEKSINNTDNNGKTIGIKLMADVDIKQNSATSYYAVLYVGHYSDTAGESFPVNVVLDLNGHTITDTSSNARMFGVYAGSSLVVTNGFIDAQGKYYSTGGMIFTSGACDVTLDGVYAKVNSGCKNKTTINGGIANINADGSLTVKNSKLEVYETTYTSGSYINRTQYGGMFYASAAVPITLDNSEFIGGAAKNGGQICVVAGVTLNATNCTFTDGVATTYGGVMHISSQSANVTLKECTFTGGTAASGGQISTTTSPTINAIDCTFTGGSATAGGCAYIYSSAATDNGPEVTFTRCDISDCDATNGGGGNLYVGNKSGYYPAYVTLKDCTVSGGDATTASSKFGGNMYAAGNTLTVDGVNFYTTITFDGGTVSSGSAAYGGNIGVAGATKVEFTGGVQVSGGIATSKGGNFYSGNANVVTNMYDATFTGGTAPQGSNVQPNAGTFNMYGGTITGGTVKNNGDLFYVAGSGILNVYGGTLEHTESTTPVSGAGKFYAYNATVNGFDPSAAVVEGHSTATQIEGTGNWIITHDDLDGTANNIAATCTTAGKIVVECATCTTTYNGKTYGAPYTYTVAALGHTEETVAGKAPTCTDTGLTDGAKCTVCGETTVAQEEIAANGHTEEIIPGKAPTCNDTGLTEGKVCTVCGETTVAQEEIAAAGHTEEIIPGKAPTCNDTGLTEGKKCSVCGEILTAQETVASTGHAWDEGVIDPAPTCNNAGTKTYTCATCGETKTEVVDATGHTAVIDEAKAPTCTETGLTEGSHCDVCGEIIVAQELVDALGHNEEVVPGKAPTCTETGLTEGTKCTVCGETVIAQEEIAALGHNEEVVPGKAPTCTETGLTDGAKCTVCGETTVAQEEIAALGHSEEVVPGKAPTCTETGLTDGAKCTVCGETTVAQEEIAALGHSYSSVYTEPTYEADGYTTYTCGTCGDTYTEIDEGTKLTAAAKIGDTMYKTLAAAIEAAQTGETVTLLDDVALTEQLTVSKALTLNLNGFDITGNVAGAYGMIYVGVKGNLTVVSTPAVATFSVEGSEITNEGGYAIGNYGTLSVDNVALTGTDAALYNFYYNGTTYGKATIGENASVSSVWNCGELTVNGAADYIDNSGALTVNGTVNELYAQDGSDAADVPGAGTVTVADTSMVTVPEGYKLVETETAGTYEVVEITYAAQIGETLYQTLKEAVAAVQDGETIQLVAGAVISEGTIKLPATLKNVTVKGAEGAVLKDMTVMAYDGSSFSYEGLTFDGITFDNSRISITGWRNGGAVAKDITVTNCTFKNLNDTTNSAPVHFNMAETEPVENLTFTNNVIDGATGGSKSGVYAQVTGKTVFTGNTINNVSFRPYVVQVTTDDGIADEFIVTGNTFSGSAAGRAQALANNNEGTDTVKLVVSGNIFKDITNAQQICYWNFNAETTTADLSGNYYDIDILANPNKIYFNSAAKNAEDLIEMGIYPYYADEAMTQEVTAPAIMVTYADGTVEYFDDMRAAVPHSSNVPKLEGATVTLLKDMSGLGMRLMENGMVFDLNGYTYTLTGGTGSKGTETSAFQIRPEVTETATIKNGTIKIAEGVAIAWIFNNYATNLVVEDVVVDCTNMDWGYGESCYAVVSREGDNVQLTGNTKFENFNSEVAGNAVISQGTMTIGENVIPGGTVELGAGATLTAREGLSVVTENGYFVKYADGTYTTVQAVAQIGETYYATFEEAVANIATDGSDTTIKLLTDIEIDQSIICEYGDGKIIFTADQPVTVKQTAVADLDFTKATNTVIVIGENVTFEIYDNASGIYLYYGPSMEISGTVTGGQNWGVLYLYDGEHTVTETGTLSVGRVQMGHTILTVLGTMDSNYLLVEGSEFVADGATVNVGAIHDSNNGAARWGASTMDFLNGTNVTANTVNLAYADSVITLDLSSKLTAGKLSGIGKIVIDAAAFDGTEVTVINADLSGFTGEIEVINNASATYKIGEDGTVTVVKVMVPPNANVSVLNPITLTKDDHNYMVWPSGDATIDRPLEIVMNFKAEDTLEDCLNGGYSEWLTDFNITFTGLENGSITADNCYLAGNYGTFGWIVIPTDGLVLEDGVTYPVVAAYDASLNYEDICNSVKDFTAAIHIDQAILDANPNLQVKLELVMTNPENAEDKLYVGEPAVYTAEELKNGCVAKNTETGKMYTDLTEALRDAEDTTVVLLGDVTVRSLAINFGTTLDLNGHTLNATRISTDADSHIIDSTNGKGLLNVTGTFTLNSRNAAIPVKTTEGYRFTGLDFVTQYKNDADSKVFRTYFVGEVGEDAASMLATELANGGADNGLTVRVKLTYTNLAGTTEEEKTFSFTDALVQEYAADWLKSDFRVTIKGAEKVANLHAAVEIVSTVGDQTVVVSSEPIDLTK